MQANKLELTPDETAEWSSQDVNWNWYKGLYHSSLDSFSLASNLFLVRIQGVGAEI